MSGKAKMNRHKEKLKAMGLSDSPVLARDRNRRRERTRRFRKKRMLRNNAIVDEIKISRGCTDCGYAKHPAALEFDHLPMQEKIANVSAMRSRYTTKLSVILAEIAKCDVVCANCHRIRTAERKQQTPSAKALAAIYATRVPNEPVADLAEWRKSVGWYRDPKDRRFGESKCSKCGVAGHSIRKCPTGPDSLRRIVTRSLFRCAKTFEQVSEETAIPKTSIQTAIYAMARKGQIQRDGTLWSLVDSDQPTTETGCAAE